MMRSLFSGVSGLRVHQNRMDVIGNNIANVNTVGFKSSRMTFADAMSQRIAGASADNPQTGRAGRNPMQIGLGANVASIDRMMTPGAAQRTDHNFDLMIEGSGFFVVGDNTGTYFTRAGALRLDHANNLTISNGMAVMGWAITENMGATTEDERWVVNRGPVSPIQIQPDMLSTPPRATTRINMQGNLVPEIVRDAQGNNITEPTVVQKTIHDSLGNRHTIDMNMVPIGPADNPDVAAGESGNLTRWSVTFTIPPGTPLWHTMADDDTPLNQPIELWDELHLDFNVNGRPVRVLSGTDEWEGEDLAGIELPASIFGNAQGSLIPGDITLDFSGFTQFGNLRGSARAIDFDGLSAGELSDLSVGQDGTVMALYSNGAMRPLFRIPLAEFANPAGLEAVGGSLFRATANSGAFDGVGNDGIMRGGVLEMSNVDLSEEFTGMIVTQRGFQANSRLISTSDEMLQELVNLRR